MTCVNTSKCLTVTKYPTNGSYCCLKLCKGAALLTSVGISSPHPCSGHTNLTQQGTKGKAQKGRVTGPKLHSKQQRKPWKGTLELILDT